ncbi:MAG: alpha/beta hydrolase [Promethearchaeota archaeon]
MEVINSLRSNKKRTGLIISILVLIIGIIPSFIFTFWADFYHPYTIQQKTLTAGDGVKIVANIYSPQGNSDDHPGIVVAHGYCCNKQHMQPLSIELVKRGFTVVTIDFRGHGSSGGYLGDHNGLQLDLMAAIEYLESLENINKFALVGHSMGGEASFRYVENNPDKIDAMVAIGSLVSSSYNLSRIPNLLMAVGQFEQEATPARALEALRTYTGQTSVEIGKVYGSFIHRNASKVIVSPTSEHLNEVLDYTIIYGTVQWLELAFNGEEADDVILSSHYLQFFTRVSQIGVVALFFVLIVYISNYIFKREEDYPKEEKQNEFSVLKLSIYYILISSIGLIFSQVSGDLFSTVLPISAGDQLFAIMVGNTIGILFIYSLLVFRGKEFSLKDLQLKIKNQYLPHSERAIIYGFIAALLACSLLTGITHWNSITTVPTAREFGTILMMIILFFPFLFIKESYFRFVQSQLPPKSRIDEYFSMSGIGILMDVTIMIPIILLTWGEFLSLALTVMIYILIIQQVLTTWVYIHSNYQRRNILGSTMFLGTLYAWMMVNFFPFL